MDCGNKWRREQSSVLCGHVPYEHQYRVRGGLGQSGAAGRAQDGQRRRLLVTGNAMLGQRERGNWLDWRRFRGLELEKVVLRRMRDGFRGLPK